MGAATSISGYDAWYHVAAIPVFVVFEYEIDPVYKS